MATTAGAVAPGAAGLAPPELKKPVLDGGAAVRVDVKVGGPCLMPGCVTPSSTRVGRSCDEAPSYAHEQEALASA